MAADDATPGRRCGCAIAKAYGYVREYY